jgi:protein TonB
VRSRLETIGILEVFSTSPQAFTDDHLTLLSRLAELADAANSPATAAVDVEPEEPGSWAGAETPIRMDAYVAGSRWLPSETPRKNRWRYLAVVGGVLLVALLSTASWRAWSELKSRGAAKPLSPSSQPSAPPVESSSVSPIASPEVKPSPEQLGSSGSARSGQKQRVVQAAQIEPDQGMIHSIQTGPSPARNIDNPNRPASAAGDASANEPPTVAMVSSSDSSLNGLLNGQKTLPTLDVKVSEGTTPLVVEHKVIPAYPRQALDRRMEGTVTVHINVNDRGRVAQVKLLNGDPILGKAAMDAVKQWRYHPVLLSGKPTATETDVLITFKLP